MGNKPSHRSPDPYDFYWSGKRKLFPDWDAVKRIDWWVAKTPSNLRGKPSKLVPYLVSECQTEAEKFRAIFRWVADNINYDTQAVIQGMARRYSMNRSLEPNGVEQVLSRGVAVCAGYANLIVDLCEKAGIEVTYIGGIAKTDDFVPGDSIDLDDDQGHAWISVKLDGQNYLCDPTWAAGSVDDGNDGRKRYVRRWDENWFITEPKLFLETHWPRGIGNVGTREDVLTELQYVNKPMTDFEGWCRLPIRRGNSGRYPLMVTPVNTDGVIQSQNNMAEISFKYDKCPLDVIATVTSLTDKRELKGFSKVEHLGKNYKVHMRLPVTNVKGYLLHVSAKPFYTTMEEVLTNVLEYKIETNGDISHRAFPGDPALPFIGPSRNFLDCGFTTNSPAQLTSRDGSARLSYFFPKNVSKRREIIGKLVYENNESVNLKEEFTLGTVDTNLIADFRLKRQGHYQFSILVQWLDDTEKYYHICSHVIMCEKASSEEGFPGRERPYGTTIHFNKVNCKLLSPKTHFIVVKEGLCQIDMTIPSDKTVAFCLQKNGRKYEASDECIYAEYHRNKVTFNIQIGETGYFTFVMNEIHDSRAGEWLACFLLQCKSPYGGFPFPKLTSIWGPSRELIASGSRVSLNSSTLITKNGFGRFTLKNTYDLHKLNLKLVDVRGTELQKSVKGESRGGNIIFHFRLNELGNYRFSLHLLRSSGAWKCCLLNILVKVDKAWNGNEFLSLPKMLGEYSNMNDLRLSVSSPKSAIVTTKTGKCEIVLSGKLPVQLFHLLKLNDDNMNDRVCCETDGSQDNPKLTYLFELPTVGIYSFVVHTNSQGDNKVYSAEIDCTGVTLVRPFFTAKPVPNYQLGIVHGNKADVQLPRPRSSTLRLVDGCAKIVMNIGNNNVEKLMTWYHCTRYEDRRQFGHHVMVERSGSRAELIVAPPEPNRYLLVVAAKIKDAEELVKVGTFLIEPGDRVPKYNGFPLRYEPFYLTEGCKLLSPHRTTLERERTYECSVYIPGAKKIVVGGTVLSQSKDKHHQGKVKVKPIDKNLLVSAVFADKGAERVVHYMRFNVANKTKDQFVLAQSGK